MWFIINAVIEVTTAKLQGILLVFPKGGSNEKGVSYKLGLETAEEVAFWTNKFSETKAVGARPRVWAEFNLSDPIPNDTFTTKTGFVVPAGTQKTYWVNLTSTPTKVENYVKGNISTIPVAEPKKISSIPTS